MKKFDMFIRFHTTHERDRQTDTQTDTAWQNENEIDWEHLRIAKTMTALSVRVRSTALKWHRVQIHLKLQKMCTCPVI